MPTAEEYEAQEQLELAKMRKVAEAICAQYNYQRVDNPIVAIATAKMYACGYVERLVNKEELTIYCEVGQSIKRLIVSVLGSEALSCTQPYLEWCWVGECGNPETLRTFAQIVKEDEQLKEIIADRFGYEFDDEDGDEGEEVQHD